MKNRVFFASKTLALFGLLLTLVTTATAKPLTGNYIQRYLLLSSELETRLDNFTQESLRVCGQKVPKKEKLLLSAEDLKAQRTIFLEELPEKIGAIRKTGRKLRHLQPMRGLESSKYWVNLYTQRSDQIIDELRRGLYRGKIDEAKLKTLNDARKFAATNVERTMSRYLDTQPVVRK